MDPIPDQQNTSNYISIPSPRNMEDDLKNKLLNELDIMNDLSRQSIEKHFSARNPRRSFSQQSDPKSYKKRPYSAQTRRRSNPTIQKKTRPRSAQQRLRSSRRSPVLRSNSVQRNQNVSRNGKSMSRGEMSRNAENRSNSVPRAAAVSNRTVVNSQNKEPQSPLTPKSPSFSPRSLKQFDSDQSPRSSQFRKRPTNYSPLTPRSLKNAEIAGTLVDYYKNSNQRNALKEQIVKEKECANDRALYYWSILKTRISEIIKEKHQSNHLDLKRLMRIAIKKKYKEVAEKREKVDKRALSGLYKNSDSFSRRRLSLILRNLSHRERFSQETIEKKNDNFEDLYNRNDPLKYLQQLENDEQEKKESDLMKQHQKPMLSDDNRKFKVFVPYETNPETHPLKKSPLLSIRSNKTETKKKKKKLSPSKQAHATNMVFKFQEMIAKADKPTKQSPTKKDRSHDRPWLQGARQPKKNRITDGFTSEIVHS